VIAAVDAGNTSELRTFDGRPLRPNHGWPSGLGHVRGRDHVAVDLIDANEHQALPGDVREGLVGSGG
jgi:hypothetical protein